jgi:hypothetical protein
MSVKIIYNTYVEKKIMQALTKHIPHDMLILSTQNMFLKNIIDMFTVQYSTRFALLMMVVMIQVFWAMMPF